MSLKDIDGSAITTKYIIRFINIFVAQRIFVIKKVILALTLIDNKIDFNCR